MSGKVYSIISLIPQNGAKYIASNLGYFTKRKYKNSKVLLIDFDFDNPTLCYHFVKDSIYSIDNLAPVEIGLDKDTLCKNITKTKFKVDILKGSSLGNSNFFSKELIAKILNLSKEVYDYIFVVTSPNTNNPVTVMTLLNSDKLVLVVRNNYSNLQKIEKSLQMFSNFIKDKSDIKVISNYNDYNNDLDILKTINVDYKYSSLIDFVAKSTDNKNLAEKIFFKRKTINDRKFKELVKDLIYK